MLRETDFEVWYWLKQTVNLWTLFSFTKKHQRIEPSPATDNHDSSPLCCRCTHPFLVRTEVSTELCFCSAAKLLSATHVMTAAVWKVPHFLTLTPHATSSVFACLSFPSSFFSLSSTHFLNPFLSVFGAFAWSFKNSLNMFSLCFLSSFS